MGAQVSVGDKSKPLIAQRNFEATIHRRFVRDRLVTIELDDEFWTRAHKDEYEIKDLRSNQVIFRIPASDGCGENQRQLLLDAFRVPVLGMEWRNQKPTLAFHTITSGGMSATQAMYTFTTQFNPFEYPLELILNKESPEHMVKICVIGKWLARRGVMGIQRGEEGSIYKIAEVNSVGSVQDGKYRLDIAPGVDIALVVLFAAAMDEQSRKHECGSDRAALRTEIKREKRAERKKAQELNAVSLTRPAASAN